MNCASVERKGKRERERESYQENNRDIEQEGAHAVNNKDEHANILELGHGHPGQLPVGRYGKVHNGTDGRKIVKRHEWVHLEFWCAKDALNHGEAQTLENDTADLEQDPDEDEFDLAKGRNDDTKNDNHDVEQNAEVGLGDA